MSLGKIAIITADTRLSELCGIEVSLAGYEPCFFFSAKHIGSTYFKYLYDIDTVEKVDLAEDRTIIMTASDTKAYGARCLHLPVSLSELRKLIAFDGMPFIPFEHSKPEALVFNKESRALFVGERSVELSDHEISVLSYLCEHRGQAVKREELNALLGANDGNISDVYICHLRKKLEGLCGNRMISTVRSQGYKIDAELKYDE